MDKNLLIKFCQANPYAKLLISVLANEATKITSTTVSTAMSLLQESQISVNRNQTVHLLKQFQRLECGRFVVGRHTKHSRMIWTIDLRELRSVFPLEIETATSKSSAAQPPASNEKIHPAKILTHHFYLRDNLTIKFDLPSDFLPIEARRLGRFLESLPLME